MGSRKGARPPSELGFGNFLPLPRSCRTSREQQAQLQIRKNQCRLPTPEDASSSLRQALVIDFQERQMPSHRHPHRHPSRLPLQPRLPRTCSLMPFSPFKQGGGWQDLVPAFIIPTGSQDLRASLSVYHQAEITDMKLHDLWSLEQDFPSHKTEIPRTHLGTVDGNARVVWL